MSATEIVPLSLAEARRYVAEHHRHNEPPQSHRFSIGLERDGVLIGAVIADAPISRKVDDGRTIELRRLTTEGDRNACSRLYGAACRAAFAMGFKRVITYTLDTETGVSLLASGFTRDGLRDSHAWNGQDKAAAHPRLFDPPKMPTGPKQRWVRVASTTNRGGGSPTCGPVPSSPLSTARSSPIPKMMEDQP